MISSTHSRKTSRRRATFCKRLTSKLNLSSICYSKLFIYIYISSKTLRRTPLYIRKKSTTEHSREEEKRGMAFYVLPFPNTYKTARFVKLSLIMGYLFDVLKTSYDVAQRRTNDSNPAETNKEP